MLPYLLLISTFRIENPDDKWKVHVWWGGGFIGEVIGLLATQEMIDKRGVSWNIAFLICAVFSWLLAFAQYVIVEEVNIEHEEREDRLAYLK